MKTYLEKFFTYCGSKFFPFHYSLFLLIVACNNGQTTTPPSDRDDTLAATVPGASPSDTAVGTRRVASETAVGTQRVASETAVPLTQSMTYKKEEFLADQQFSCKGAVVSINDVEVSSRISEQIVMLRVDMGQRVRKGQVLLQLDKTAIEDKILKARAELEQAEYRYQAILMGQGYKGEALDQAPEKLRQKARSSSGYNTAKAELRQLEHQLSYCTIVAPISGVVSHLETDNYAMAVAGKPLFRIIDTDHLKVCFDVLENELSRIAVDTAITVIPISYHDDRHHTRITAVSPIVEQSGMVRMEASLPPHPHLMPGMTVIVILQQNPE